MSDLHPDPEAVEKWKQLPQNEPSREAMPPAAGGMRWLPGMLILSIIIMLVLLLQQRPA